MNNYLVTLTDQLKVLIESRLWAKVLLAMVLGILAGLLLSNATDIIPETIARNISNWLSFPGKLFIKLVQMIMIALIISSIISGIGGSTGEQLRSVGLKSLIYFILTTIIAVTIGVSITYLINPGKMMEGQLGSSAIDESFAESLSRQEGTGLIDMILNLIPENPLQAMITGEMLSIVVFSIIIGVAVIKLDNMYSTSIIKMMSAVQHICMNVVNWAMRIVPYAVFGIMAGLVATTGLESLQGLGFYTLTVLLGLFLILVMYLLLAYFMGGFKPLDYLGKIKDSMLLAFSTTSSAAVMPLSLKIAKEELKVRTNISNFIIPLGTTINMDGTALYQCVSFIFIAQVYGIELALPALLLSMFTIITASIGTPAVPGAGIIVLASVLQNAGLPAEGIITIIGIERIMGMFRAAVNVTGDLTACVVFNRIQKE